MNKTIDILKELDIGGIKQWVLIRAKNPKNPILLWLHGGPGTVSMPLSEYFDSKLIEKFIVVHWDQRGAGKSYNSKIPEETMNINQFLSDGKEVIDILRKEYSKEKIYLIGHSWGSFLGLSLASKYPELFYAYVGVSQVVDLPENEMCSYKLLMQKAKKMKNKNAIKELKGICKPPYNYENQMIKNRWVRRLGGSLHGEADYIKVMTKALLSPHYKISDFIRFFIGGEFSTRTLFKIAYTVELSKQIKEVKVPVYFIHGKYDLVTPLRALEKYYKNLKAPSKKLIIFNKSAHAPNYEEPINFQKVIINKVLKETYK